MRHPCLARSFSGAALAVLLASTHAEGQETTRVSVRGSGAQVRGDSVSPAFSADGSKVAFVSDAHDLVPWDNNGVADVFVHDRTTGVTTRVSVDSAGTEGDGASWNPKL